MNNILCITCGGNAKTPKGVIYIRFFKDGKWGNHPQCQKCWDINHKESQNSPSVVTKQ